MATFDVKVWVRVPGQMPGNTSKQLVNTKIQANEMVTAMAIVESQYGSTMEGRPHITVVNDR